jgi:hypothetical protein
MVKRDFKGKAFLKAKRLFNWLRCLRYREQRRLSDYRATSLAVKLTISGSLSPSRAISSFARSK